MGMNTCSFCGGFAPVRATSCPNCDKALSTAAPGPVARVMASILAVAASGATAVTLMACYGMPMCETHEDKDGDGVASCEDYDASDCNDDDATIHPGADDPLGDNIDQNCDGQDGVASGTGGANAGGANAGGGSVGGANAGGGNAGGASAGGAPASGGASSSGGAGGAGGAP